MGDDSSESHTGESVSKPPKIPTWMVEISWFWTAKGQHLVLATLWALIWPFLPAAQKGTPVQKNSQSHTDFILWSLAIRPRPWKGLWISNKLNLQESGAIKTERDNFIPALARQSLDTARYKMSCQFWVWEQTPKQVNPSLTGVYSKENVSQNSSKDETSWLMERAREVLLSEELPAVSETKVN